MSPPLLPTLILSSFLSFIFSTPSVALAARTPRTCYSPDGTVLDPSIYVPCKYNSPQSMCCPTSHRRNGLSKGAEGTTETWRAGCTDPTWDSPFCVKDFHYNLHISQKNQHSNKIIARAASTPPSSAESEIPTSPPRDTGERALSTAAVAAVAAGAAGAIGLLITGFFLWLHRKRKRPNAPSVPVFPYEMSGAEYPNSDFYEGRRNDGIFEMSTRPPRDKPKISRAKGKEEEPGRSIKWSSRDVERSRDDDETKSVS